MNHFPRRLWLQQAGGLLAAMLPPCHAVAADGATVKSADEPIASQLLDPPPSLQVATYRHVDRMAPVRAIARGSMPVNVLAPHSRRLDDLRYRFRGQAYPLAQYMLRNRVSGLLVLKDGRVALERYAMGNVASSRWTSFSLAKSVTATLVGAALQDRVIGSLDDRVTRYLPKLANSAYGGNTLRELMRMASGVRWREGYLDKNSEIPKYEAAYQSRQAGQVLDFLATLPRVNPPGKVWNYSTGDTYVLGAVLTAALRRPLSVYFSERIWSRLGMQADGYWMLDAPDGQELAGHNFSATLHDYGRFGQFILDDGVIGGTSVLPPGWRDEAGHPAPVAPGGYGKLYPGYAAGYGYQWWSFPRGAAALPFHDGAFIGKGIYGQYLYVNPKDRVVAVVWSAYPDPVVIPNDMETQEFFAAAVAALR